MAYIPSGAASSPYGIVNTFDNDVDHTVFLIDATATNPYIDQSNTSAGVITPPSDNILLPVNGSYLKVYTTVPSNPTYTCGGTSSVPVPTTLTSGVSATDTTMVVATATNFAISKRLVIAPDTANQEYVTISNVVGTTITIESPGFVNPHLSGVVVQSPLRLQSSLTGEAIIIAHSQNPKIAIGFSGYPSSGQNHNHQWQFTINPTSSQYFGMYWENGSAVQILAFPTKNHRFRVPVGQPIHLAWVRNDLGTTSTVTTYLNGALIGVSAAVNNPDGGDDAMQVYFGVVEGSLVSARVSDYAMDAAQVAASYSALVA